MKYSDRFTGRNDHLKRLPPEHYQGKAYVHWTMTMEDRKTGWLFPIFYYKFREILTHTLFRYGLCCPIYCCMPDHLHLLWIGVLESSDQLLAARYFRKQMNEVLEYYRVRFQEECYDHVLREQEIERSAFEEIFAYIAQNTERAGLVGQEGFRDYPFTGCLMPGYPDLKIWSEDFWERLWRIQAYLTKHGVGAGGQP